MALLKEDMEEAEREYEKHGYIPITEELSRDVQAETLAAIGKRSALTKEEYLFGIISKPEVKSDLFIDRGITTIFEKHLKLSEITNINELSRYGRGYFNVTKQ